MPHLNLRCWNGCRNGLALACLAGLLAWSSSANGTELRVGRATVDITPDQPVALSGQMGTRISQAVETPVIAAALAIESRDGDAVIDQAILVACDLVAIRAGLADRVREQLSERIPDFDAAKLILSATHTHTAPETIDGLYHLPDTGIMKPGDYADFLVRRITDVAVRAWNNRAPAKVGWGLGHAVVAQNRRAVYADGHAQMYGATDAADFKGIEGYEDHGVEILFVWDRDDRLIATAINVACPAQEVEGRSAINADFWHQVREQLRERHGEDLVVLGWIGAAGDQSPHLMFRKAAEERMRTLRGLDRLGEIARRVVAAWEDAHQAACGEQYEDVPFVHNIRAIDLPTRRVTSEEYENAKARVRELSVDPANRRRIVWHQDVVDRYEREQSGTPKPYTMELHALRLGDIAIVTNDFELFTEYGIRMKARAKAIQTFVIQLAGPGTYLATAEAVAGGGYSAIVESNLVGPEGGDVLVEETVGAINALWPAP